MGIDFPQIFSDSYLVALIFIWDYLFFMPVGGFENRSLYSGVRGGRGGRWGVWPGRLCETTIFWVSSLRDCELRWGEVVLTEPAVIPDLGVSCAHCFHLNQSHQLSFHFLLPLLSVWKFSIILDSALLFSVPTFLLRLWFSTLLAHWNHLGSFINYGRLCPTPRDVDLFGLESSMDIGMVSKFPSWF